VRASSAWTPVGCSAGLRQALVPGLERFLDLAGGADGLDGARELGEDAVARGVDDPAVVEIDDRVDDGPVRREQAEGGFLVISHEPRVSGHVGRQDRDELALDGCAHRLLGGAILAQGHLVLDAARGLRMEWSNGPRPARRQSP
jgi:hypothetical protein